MWDPPFPVGVSLGMCVDECCQHTVPTRTGIRKTPLIFLIRQVAQGKEERGQNITYSVTNLLESYLVKRPYLTCNPRWAHLNGHVMVKMEDRSVL